MLFAFFAVVVLIVSLAIYVLKVLSPHNKTITLFILSIILAALLIFKNLFYSITYSIKSFVTPTYQDIDLPKEFFRNPILESLDPLLDLSEWLKASL